VGISRKQLQKLSKNLIGITGVTNHIRIMKTSNDTVKEKSEKMHLSAMIQLIKRY
jgi:isochorismate hydrolase